MELRFGQARLEGFELWFADFQMPSLSETQNFVMPSQAYYSERVSRLPCLRDSFDQAMYSTHSFSELPERQISSDSLTLIWPTSAAPTSAHGGSSPGQAAAEQQRYC